jgi:hypothetical protein
MAQPVLTMHARTVAQLAGVLSVVAVQPSSSAPQSVVEQLWQVSPPPLPPDPELPLAPLEPALPPAPPTD